MTNTDRDTQMLSYAIEAEPALFPHLVELLADLDELGCDPETYVDLLRPLDLPPATRVLDVGCGKGAASLEIARALPFTVHGIDLHAPFVDCCRTAAIQAGVAERCTFERLNILDLMPGEQYDVLIFAALGNVLGPWNQTIATLRRYVRSGGYLLVSDDFVRPGCTASFTGFELYVGHDEMVAHLTASGDELMVEIIDEDDGGDVAHQAENARIEARANALAKKFPALAKELAGFVEAQRAECAFLEENMGSATWLLRRT